MFRITAAVVVLLVTLNACSGESVEPSTPDDPITEAAEIAAPTPDATRSEDAGSAEPETAEARIEAIQTQVSTWAGTGDLATAMEAAEGAINLVVGEDGPYFGDATGNGVVTGGAGPGLLPGLDGEAGLAQSDADDECVLADVLGGSWEDPADRWDILDVAIEEWTVSNNPFPTLPSHPQRIVGWARLTLQAETIEEAVEFASHAQLHVNVSRDAYAC